MIKLEELGAAYDAARAVQFAAWADAHLLADGNDESDAAWLAADLADNNADKAWDAYYDELTAEWTW
jgi:hypothetical protein